MRTKTSPVFLPMLCFIYCSFLFIGLFTGSIGSPPSHSRVRPGPSTGELKAQQRFATLCITCHGPAGRGNGPAGKALQPRPRDFTDYRWQDSVTDQHLKQIILQGGGAFGKSPLMPANPDLEGQDDVLDALARIVRRFRNENYTPLEEVAAANPPALVHVGAPQEVGFDIYQDLFAKTFESQKEAAPASGPIWLQPDVLAKEEACTSCHLGIEDNGLLYARPPYRRHSGHYLEDHPSGRFGCTICHGGDGSALTFAGAAHPQPGSPALTEIWRQNYGWRIPDAAGMVPLKWITGRCALCHDGTNLPPGAEPYRNARQVIAEKQCAACHEFRDEALPEIPLASHLGHPGSKLSSTWLRDFLQNPSSFHGSSPMPFYEFQEGELLTLSGYLDSLRNPEIGWPDHRSIPDAAAVERGRKVVTERQCQTCHDLPGIEERGFEQQRKIGPSLARVGEKLNPRWIAKWLANPEAMRPGTGMPRFRWSNGEIEDVTAFLSSLLSAVPAQISKPSAPDPEAAEGVLARYRCAACHSFADRSTKPQERSDLSRVGSDILARMAHSSGSHDSLEGAAGIFHRSPDAPHLFAPDEPIDAVMTYLAGEVDIGIPDAFRAPQAIRKAAYRPSGRAGDLADELRCLSCHKIHGSGGDIGPDLTNAGSKLKRDWLIQFLQDPVAIRPMHPARMPKLGISAAEAEVLADWISSELKSPEIENSEPDLEMAFAFVGAAKVESPYGCVACHRIEDKGGTIGPDLTHVANRLKTKWIYEWISDPQHWSEDARMPKFEMPEDDLLAITLYLSERR